MAMTTLDVFERYGLTGRLIFENALRQLQAGEKPLEEALDYIMEFARGGWKLVIDENLESLAVELSKIRYAVLVIPKGTSDEDVLRKYATRGVFITSDSSDFNLSMVPDPFDEGMIIVPNGVDSTLLTKVIEAHLMNWRSEHPAQPVKLKIARGDV
jgi:hypothetical protein